MYACQRGIASLGQRLARAPVSKIVSTNAFMTGAAAVRSSSSNAVAAVYQDDVSVKKITYPGTRMLLLNDPTNGNMLTSKAIRELNANLTECAHSEAAAVVFFSSANTSTFSKGIDSAVLFDEKKSSAPLCRYVQSNAHLIRTFSKPTVAMWMGEAAGTAFGAFSGSEYRLASPSATLRITELHRGQVPIGGLAYHLARGCAEGPALARYLALTQRPVHGHELLSLGVVTHVVGERPYDSLANAISQSIHGMREDMVKSHFTPPVDLSFLPELLDAMDVRDPAGGEGEGDMGETSGGVPSFTDGMAAADGNSDGDCEWDLYAHPVWQQASLVPEKTLTTADMDALLGKSNSNNVTAEAAGSAAAADLTDSEVDLVALLPDIELCFNSVTNKTVADTVGRLTALDTPWSRAVLKLIEPVEGATPVARDALQLWYGLTDGATRWSYEEVLKAEYCAIMNLVQRRTAGTAIDHSTALKKMPVGAQKAEEGAKTKGRDPLRPLEL